MLLWGHIVKCCDVREATIHLLLNQVLVGMEFLLFVCFVKKQLVVVTHRVVMIKGIGLLLPSVMLTVLRMIVQPFCLCPFYPIYS